MLLIFSKWPWTLATEDTEAWTRQVRTSTGTSLLLLLGSAPIWSGVSSDVEAWSERTQQSESWTEKTKQNETWT